ncbi:41357_t:CDS:2, partial [Gigaspora margarita]
DEKDSLEVNTFWINRDIELGKKRKLWQIELSDDQQLEKHIKVIRENRMTVEQTQSQLPEANVPVMDLSSILNDSGNSYTIINGSDDDIISSGNSEVQLQDSPATTLPAYESDNNKTDQCSVNMKSLSSMSFESAVKGRKYINYDLADEVLKSYQMHILPDHKLIYDNVDVMEFARSIMETTKKIQISKNPLSIGVIDIHNVECLKYLPQGFKKYIADQMQNTDDSIYFSEGKFINKFLLDCEEEVLEYLEKFDKIDNLKSLEECLDKNRINHSTSSNDLIYVENLFLHFLLLYKNDVLTQSLTETEFNAYIWTPMLRNAFLGKSDLRLKCGEVASRSYDKLKEILNVVTRSGPRLDGKGFLKSLGTEILAQEDGAISTHAKRTGDLQKLEYCSKVILTALFFALPSHVKDKIKDLEVYSLQSNEFQLKISTSKFLFEDTVVSMGLARVEIPRTVECFSKLVVGVKAILSWKARTRKNTMMFYDTLREGHRRLSDNGVHFSPIKFNLLREDDFDRMIMKVFEEEARIEKERRNEMSTNVVTPAKADNYDDVYFDEDLKEEEGESNEVKSDDENDSEEEMPDELDDDGYSGCGGYHEYGESDRGYYYDLSSGKKTYTYLA